ncbi:hypothetical protein NPIL_43301 [Nephila pilipes]|uniref:Uncharacterized protein n=1 Tax=Nephila pilipes TaxID=299642 RepID=A0A8X6P380_NEPPI|nr:hypothetical protein NPIL_43301 [Nephila pilipes]
MAPLFHIGRNTNLISVTEYVNEMDAFCWREKKGRKRNCSSRLFFEHFNLLELKCKINTATTTTLFLKPSASAAFLARRGLKQQPLHDIQGLNLKVKQLFFYLSRREGAVYETIRKEGATGGFG